MCAPVVPSAVAPRHFEIVTKAFIWLRAWVRALTAESFALLSMRIISTSPSPDLGVASATPASTARAAISASVGSLFPFR